MPYQRKSIALHRLQGTYRPHRHADRRDPDPRDELTHVPPPAHLRPAEAAIWTEVLAVAPPGVLIRADAFLLEMFCASLARYRRGRDELSEAPMLIRGKRGSVLSPLVSELRRAETALAELGTRLGLAPAARIRLAMGSPADDDATDAEFLQMFGPLRVIRGERA